MQILNSTSGFRTSAPSRLKYISLPSHHKKGQHTPSPTQRAHSTLRGGVRLWEARRKFVLKMGNLGKRKMDSHELAPQARSRKEGVWRGLAGEVHGTRNAERERAGDTQFRIPSSVPGTHSGNANTESEPWP